MNKSLEKLKVTMPGFRSLRNQNLEVGTRATP